MRKYFILFILLSFLASCSGYRPAQQTWVPKKHKPVDLSKPPKRKR